MTDPSPASKRESRTARMTLQAHVSVSDPAHLNQPVLGVAGKHLAKLRVDFTVEEALRTIRQQGLGERIVYFYVLDENDRLAGVVPVRRLLTAAPGELLGNIMIRRVKTIPHTATILDACDAFVSHKLLAFPIVDDEMRILGVVDVRLLAEEVPDIAELSETDTLFETIGFRVSSIRGASAFKAFRIRFPWLLATVLSGTLCALLVSHFELTLSASLILAFFMTLALGLGESVGIQSMTVAIQSLRATTPTLGSYLAALRREVATTALLGLACGTLVGAIVVAWRGTFLEGAAIGASIALALVTAAVFGLSIPTLLHALRLDPKISAGPLTLALTDLATLVFYFSIATVWLG